MYDATSERQIRLVQTVASAMGAEIDVGGSRGGYDSSSSNTHTVYDGNDLQSLPFGLGYERIE